MGEGGPVMSPPWVRINLSTALIHCKDKLRPKFFVSVKLFRKKVFFPTAHVNTSLDVMVNSTANGKTVKAQVREVRLLAYTYLPVKL